MKLRLIRQPFNSLKYREECAALLEGELRELGLVSALTGRIDPQAFQDFICRSQESQNDKEEYFEKPVKYKVKKKLTKRQS